MPPSPFLILLKVKVARGHPSGNREREQNMLLFVRQFSLLHIAPMPQVRGTNRMQRLANIYMLKSADPYIPR